MEIVQLQPALISVSGTHDEVWRYLRETMPETFGTEKEQRRAKKNGPCPCGSGRKFKKCCRRQ